MKHNFDRIQHIIGLTLVEGVGPVLAKRLISYCGSPQEVFKEKANKLALVPGIGDLLARMVVNSKKVLNRAEKEIEFCIDHGIDPISYLDDNYPARLKNCEDGPAYVFVKGQAELNPKRMVNIIGTRHPSPFAIEFTDKLVEDLATYDLTVVSGMAYGIDIVAHRACLKYGIPTIGVVAHGLDRIYPQIHRATAAKMVKNGALLTEFLTGNEPDRENFPKRNRIVAGICDATIVIETGIKGGSMITARLAMDYNRDVFAMPGRPGDEKTAGCNLMIKNHRAGLFENANDIVEIMGWQNNRHVPAQTKMFVELNEEEARIVDFLKAKGKVMIDIISFELEMPISKVNVIMLGLEFKGVIRSLPGKIYEVV